MTDTPEALFGAASENNSSTLSSVPFWTTTLLFQKILLSRPIPNESNGAHRRRPLSRQDAERVAHAAPVGSLATTYVSKGVCLTGGVLWMIKGGKQIKSRPLILGSSSDASGSAWRRCERGACAVGRSCLAGFPLGFVRLYPRFEVLNPQTRWRNFFPSALLLDMWGKFEARLEASDKRGRSSVSAQ